MMEQYLKQSLEKLRAIEPKAEFKKHSLTLILSAPQNDFSPNAVQRLKYLMGTPKLGLIFGMSAIFIFLILSGFSLLYLQPAGKPALVSSLNPQAIEQEMKTLNIQFSQIRYYENLAKKIEIALQKASNKPSPSEKQIEQLFNEITL